MNKNLYIWITIYICMNKYLYIWITIYIYIWINIYIWEYMTSMQLIYQCSEEAQETSSKLMDIFKGNFPQKCETNVKRLQFGIKSSFCRNFGWQFSTFCSGIDFFNDNFLYDFWECRVGHSALNQRAVMCMCIYCWD